MYKKSSGAVSVHTATASNVKRLWVAVSVKKICLKCQHFRIVIFSNYSKNLGKISSKIFSLKIDCYKYDYFPDIYLKFLITQLFLKIFPKYRKNFLKIACFKSFLTVPLNFLRISKYVQSSCKLLNPFFLKLIPIWWKILHHIFMVLCAPFAWSLL